MKVKNLMKKIAYVSGTRADFGLMTHVLTAISINPMFHLDVYATGMHLMPKFGYTFGEVKEKFQTVKKINSVIESDSKESMSKFFSSCMSLVVSEFINNRPDIALVLGDRGEMLAVASACLYLGIPVAHIHGGDVTGTVDEVVRHAITKLSHIHFPATYEAAKRIRKMGEEAWRIHVVGSPSLDAIRQQKFTTKNETCGFLHIGQNENYLLLTIHPDGVLNRKNVEEILAAVKTFHMPIVVIYPNADEGSDSIISAIEKNRQNPLFHIYKNIPFSQYLSIKKEAGVWIGNSSAGIIESPSFHVPVVNIGPRQNGRISSPNIINVAYKKKCIEDAIATSLTDKAFLRMIRTIRNPWGDGKSADRIIRELEKLKIDEKLLMKKFVS